MEIQPNDLSIKAWSSARPPSGLVVGTANGVQITHIPTGFIVQCDTERTQHLNRAKAMEMLREKLSGMEAG